MFPFLSRHASTGGLLEFLYATGRTDERTDPHLVDSWMGLALPDPGRDAEASVQYLAELLDQPIVRRAAELGRALPRRPWMCVLRTVPGARELTDEEWASAARRVVEATGIAPAGDGRGCRWIAVRRGADRVAVVATLMREDGRWPQTQLDCRRVVAECRLIAEDLQLPLAPTLDAPAVGVTVAEERSRRETSKEILGEAVDRVAAQCEEPEEFLVLLSRIGVRVHQPARRPGLREVPRLLLSLPGDRDARGRTVWIRGSELDPALTPQGLPEYLASRSWGRAEHRSLPLPMAA